MIFDVGANIGATARDLARRYPAAQIHAFEPDPENYRTMRAAVAGLQIHPHNLGLGSAASELRFDTSGQHDMRRIAGDQNDASLPLVQITTLDAFCSKNGIEQIDYLKIDTEGHDLQVLKGASGLLAQGVIGIAEAECSMNRDNRFHVAFTEVHQFMEDHGYRLFGLYEQAHEWPEQRPNLRRANAVYISPSVINRNTPCSCSYENRISKASPAYTPSRTTN